MIKKQKKIRKESKKKEFFENPIFLLANEKCVIYSIFFFLTTVCWFSRRIRVIQSDYFFKKPFSVFSLCFPFIQVKKNSTNFVDVSIDQIPSLDTLKNILFNLIIFDTSVQKKMEDSTSSYFFVVVIELFYI